MNYIYDILLNFQKNYYDFYEWNSNDEITHIRKILLFKITDYDFNILKCNTVCFDKEFVNKIYNRTEKFKKVNVSLLKYVFVISNGKEAMALKLGKNGITTHKSSLLFDENDEIAEIADELKTCSINYQIRYHDNNTPFKTREEKENSIIILNNLEKLYKNKEYDKIKYLYLECFSKEEKDTDKAFNKIKKAISNQPEIYLKIYDFFKIINQK